VHVLQGHEYVGPSTPTLARVIHLVDVVRVDTGPCREEETGHLSVPILCWPTAEGRV